MKEFAAIGLLIGLLCAALGGQVQGASYKFTDLGTLGGPESWALAVNSKGAVVGCSVDGSGCKRAFLWTEQGGMVDLGTLGGKNSAATDINDAGEIAGYADTADGARHAFLRTADGNMVDLGVLPDDSSSEAAAVEDLVVGTSRGAEGQAHAFQWGIESGLTRIAPLVVGGEAQAYDINSVGTLVGAAKDASGNLRAVIWLTRSEPADLGTLGGVSSRAYGINKGGIVVGEAANADGEIRAFCWTPASGIQELVLPKGASSARAISINNANRVVGSAVIANCPRAVFWDLGSDEIRIARKVALLPCPSEAAESEATAISDGGLIAGYCRTADGHRRALLWSPVDDRRLIPIAIVGGAFVPSSRATRDKFDETWYRVAFKTFERVRSTAPRFTAEIGSYRLNGPARARLTPITFGFEKGFRPGKVCQSYAALRLGPYFGKYQELALGIDETNVGLNVNAAYGIIFTKSFYVELRYDYFTRLANTNFSGASLSAGFWLFDVRL